MSLSFPGFFAGGFECSTLRHNDGRRIDVIAGTGHDRHADKDYLALRAQGMRVARDGLRWHLVERVPGRYDWSSLVPLLRAGRHAGVRTIWDLCHYGWPDDLDIWSAAFVDRFARFCGAAARVIRDGTEGAPWYCPVNEMSFLAWAGGDMGDIFPSAVGRGDELKRQLVRASAAGIEAVRAVSPDARLLVVDPVINVLPEHDGDPAEAEGHRLAQYQAWDMLAGRVAPELGGHPSYLDVIGVNYYRYNQWCLGGRAVFLGEPGYRPLREMLAETWRRYGCPVVIAETGAEGKHRVPWLRYVCDEAAAAIDMGVPVEGLCWYPVTDYPGWANDRHCDTGLFGYVDVDGMRPVDAALSAELLAQRARFARLTAAAAEPALAAGLAFP